jgi:hypothetical protein
MNRDDLFLDAVQEAIRHAPRGTMAHARYTVMNHGIEALKASCPMGVQVVMNWLPLEAGEDAALLTEVYPGRLLVRVAMLPPHLRPLPPPPPPGPTLWQRFVHAMTRPRRWWWQA